MRTFKAALRQYRNACTACGRKSGKDLEDAQDQEARALADLIATPATTAPELMQKLAVLRKLITAGSWSDGRDTAVLDSINRDLRNGFAQVCATIAHILTVGMIKVPHVAGLLLANSIPNLTT
jgi:hypothetical protein